MELGNTAGPGLVTQSNGISPCNLSMKLGQRVQRLCRVRFRHVPFSAKRYIWWNISVQIPGAANVWALFPRASNRKGGCSNNWEIRLDPVWSPGVTVCNLSMKLGQIVQRLCRVRFRHVPFSAKRYILGQVILKDRGKCISN